MSPLHGPGLHESAQLHVRGTATYIDDQPPLPGEVHGYPVISPQAHAKIGRCDTAAALAESGVLAVLFAADIPGENQIGPIAPDEPLLAEGEVHCVGQMVALVLAESFDAARRGAQKVEIEYEPLPASLDLRAAIEAGDFLGEALELARGEPIEEALAAAPHRIEGTVDSPAQDHFYLETQAARAVPGEAGTFFVSSSTQHPAECQAKAAEVLGIARAQVVVESPRMGGAFGGKESQAAYAVGLAVLGAHHLGRPVRVRFDRELDMKVTGKRHPWHSRYRIGFDDDGRLLALEVETFAAAGWSLDLSVAILQRCLFHLDNAYFIPSVRYRGRAVRLNLVSNTAFRGFGGPQGMLVIEEIMSRVAEKLGQDPAALRASNFYGVHGEMLPWGQSLGDNRLGRIWSELARSSAYENRQAAIAHFNTRHRFTRRGLAFVPVRFGISFTTAFLNQAGAYLLVYADGSVQLNHGGTEMGQGLHAKMRAICAHELGVSTEQIRMMPTATDKIPNTSATAASSGSDLNGQAVRDACEKIRARLRPVAAKLHGLVSDAGDDVAAASALRFVGGGVEDPASGVSVAFAEVAQAAYLAQVPLSATGFYRTPKLHFDWSCGRGQAFHYFAFGGAVCEVEVSGITGEYRLLQVDILHDAGQPLLPTLDRGQIEGGFAQGLGWLSCEELRVGEDGALLTVGPSTYKIPAAADLPERFTVKLLSGARQAEVIHGSKAVGEPPFMLALAVPAALRAAVRAFAPVRDEPPDFDLALPATPEQVLRAIEAVRADSPEPDASGEPEEPQTPEEPAGPEVPCVD